MNINEIKKLAGIPLNESEKKKGAMESGEMSVEDVLWELADTDYMDPEDYFKMVQLLKGLAASSKDDDLAADFLSAVSDALTEIVNGMAEDSEGDEEDDEEDDDEEDDEVEEVCGKNKAGKKAGKSKKEKDSMEEADDSYVKAQLGKLKTSPFDISVRDYDGNKTNWLVLSGSVVKGLSKLVK